MSGAAAAGGFAYQHAQAIQAAMRLAEEPDLARIRVEADNDAIDLEIWSVDDVLVEASQFKRVASHTRGDSKNSSTNLRTGPH